VSTLEDGLNRTPDNRTLITATLDLLMTTGRGDRALELLHGLLAPQFSGPNGTLLRTDEVLATLSAEGPAAAQKVLAGYPDLKTTTDALPVVAEVLWASQSRQAAIETLAAYIRAKPDNLIAYLSLAGYQQKAGLIGEARQTAEAACARFPNDVATRLLRIDVFEPTRASEVSSWEKDIGSYVKDFGNRREALTELAELSGQKGWVDPARLLYEAAVGRQQDFRAEAMYYSDALMFHHSYQQALRILAEIDRQTPETASSFSVLLWQREIVAAAACGDHDDARESARRVASALRRDPEGLESIRQRFIRMGIPEAVAELTVTSPDLKAAAPKKS
jgi:predicted Zn-dependent protease